ncbi:unnamed protein product, partial [Prorocentrum cordatum]
AFWAARDPAVILPPLLAPPTPARGMSSSARVRGPASVLVAAAAASSAAAQRLRITNGCGKEPLWVAHMAGAEDDGPDPQNAKLGPGEHRDFDTHDGLSATRYWPKMRCDDQGNSCLIGESGGPGQDCTNCAPPIDTKFEGTFGTDQGIDWIDVSLVDGWTLPFKFKMTLKGSGKCNAGDGNRSVMTSVDCSTLTLDKCPSRELLNSEQTNLQVIHPDEGQVVGCYSPCAKLTSNNWGNTLADGVSPTDDKAVEYCCPTPPESPDACRAGPVEKTSFVKAVHKNCPGVYGYSYDDGMGLITCPKDTKYEMIFYCPDGDGQTTTTTTVPAKKSVDHSKELKNHGGKTKGSKDHDKEKSSSSSESAEQVAFLLETELKYPFHEYCGDSYLFQGAVSSQRECQDKCSGDDSCSFYSYWTTGHVPWCGTTPSCEYRESDSVENVTMYKKVRFSGSSTSHELAPAVCCFEDSSVDEPCKAGCRSRNAVKNGFCVPRDTWCDTCSDDSVCSAPIVDASLADASKKSQLMIMRKDAFHAFVNERRGRGSTWRSPVVTLVFSTAALTVAAALALKVRRAVAWHSATVLNVLRQEGPRSASPGTIGSTSPGSTIGSPMPPRSP